MGCIYTYCTAMNDLSLNRISKDNEKFDRWVKWVGNEIRVKFCLSENEMCVWSFGRAHGLKNRKSNASFLTNTFICLYLQFHMCKGVPRIHTSIYNKEESLFTSTGRVQYYRFVRIIRNYLCIMYLKSFSITRSPLLFVFWDILYFFSNTRKVYQANIMCNKVNRISYLISFHPNPVSNHYKHQPLMENVHPCHHLKTGWSRPKRDFVEIM